MNKYNAKKTIIDGIKFDSKGEAERYCELKLLQREGVIHGLQCHPKFELAPSLRREAIDGKSRTVAAITYKADFSYTEGRYIVVEDFKGAKDTADFSIRKRLFMAKHPHVLFRVTRSGKPDDEWYPARHQGKA